MPERKIIFAGDPPPRRFPLKRLAIAIAALAAVVVLAQLFAISLGLAEKRATERGKVRVEILNRVLESAHARAQLVLARRPRTDRPMSASETAELIRAGAPPFETIQLYRASQPYLGPPEGELLERIADGERALDRLYGEAAALGLARDEIDGRIRDLVRAHAVTPTAEEEPDALGELGAQRARAGLPPLAR